ncbi:hypothetical protein NL676_014603 [Syzygium grande]|nr:hypothetical protein NL676_014603 [Syzygium grande]
MGAAGFLRRRETVLCFSSAQPPPPPPAPPLNRMKPSGGPPTSASGLLEVPSRNRSDLFWRRRCLSSSCFGLVPVPPCPKMGMSRRGGDLPVTVG